MGFPGGKESACNAGDLDSIPGSWKRAWQLTPIFLPGESRGQGRLVGYSPWGHKESDTTERLTLKEATLRITYRESPKRGELTTLCDWVPGECVRNWYPERARGRTREGAQKGKEQPASHRKQGSHPVTWQAVLRLSHSRALSWLSAADARATFLWCQQDSSHWHCFLREVILWHWILTTRPPGNSPGRKWFFQQGNIILASADNSAGP